MTIEIESRIIYLYCITCVINKKVYIGQTVNPNTRWRAHCRDAANPKVPFHFAIKKHGNHNFEFKIIASCKGQDNANELETELVKQYSSYVQHGKGYNATHGGMNAPKSEEWRQAMRAWHASIPIDKREELNEKARQAMFNQIATQGHPGLGKKRTPEQSETLSRARLANPVIWTDEMRKHQSEALTGKVQSEETIAKRVISLKEVWAEKLQEKEATGELKCNAPNCDVSGAYQPYKIIDGIRYCNKHGLRLLNYGDLISRKPNYKGKRKFTQDQIDVIIADKRPLSTIARDLGVIDSVIVRVKKAAGYITKKPNVINFTDQQKIDIAYDPRPYEQIAKIYNCSQQTIVRLKTKMGTYVKFKKPRNKVEFNEDQVKAIIADKRSLIEIAKTFNSTRRVITRIKKEAGIAIKNPNYKDFTNEQITSILNDNRTLKEIGNAYGVSRDTIIRLKKKAKLP
jgi:group I intron endonuclease